jgi:orotate phosphoribosyltransferase
MMAEQVQDLDIDVVVGPALCGIVLSQWVAHHLSKIKKREILSVFTEKSTDDVKLFDRPQMLKRGYDALVRGKRVLVVEDLSTTGVSVKKVVERVRQAGGAVVCVFILVNRNPKDITAALMGSPLKSLAVFKADAYDAQNCPLCKNNIPINTEVGHGKEYLLQRTHI